MYIVADGLFRLLAPILPVTTDEAWRLLPGQREESVHLALFPARRELQSLPKDEGWDELMELRNKVLATIEPRRQAKEIGSSLQAKVTLSMTERERERFGRYPREFFATLFIVSAVDMRQVGSVEEPGMPDVGVERVHELKCERCWRYVIPEPVERGLCQRCEDALPKAVSLPS